MKKLISILLTIYIVMLSITDISAIPGINEPLATTEKPAVTEQVPSDTHGRDNPRSTVKGYLAAMAREDFDKAALYLDVKGNNGKGADLAEKLKFYLDKSGTLESSGLISDEILGKQNDELESGFDKIGVITYKQKTINVLLERVTVSEGRFIWLISKDTLEQIDELPSIADGFNISIIDRFLPEVLIANKMIGVPIGHWLGIILLLGISIVLSFVVTKGLNGLAVFLLKRYQYYEEKYAKIVTSFLLPVKIALTIAFFILATEKFGISIIARQKLSSLETIGYWAAFLILLWRLIGILTWISEQNMLHRKNYGSLSALFFFRRCMKLVLICVGIILALDALGYDVTTGIAALGIGGLAVALGAQKTIENIVGSLTLIFDQPVRVGDYCKVGDIKGTIEQIGIRSTRIRTQDRTIIVIPNGYFSSLAIENYTHRDNFWLNFKLGFRFESTPDQIRFLLVEIRSILYAHPKVNDDPARVRFLGFGPDALNIEVYAYVLAKNYNEFLEIQEDINLRIADIVRASGTDFAFPSQTIYFAKDTGVSKERLKEIEEIVAEWKNSGDLQIPRFDAEKIKSLQGTIDYPPKGSVSVNSKA